MTQNNLLMDILTQIELYVLKQSGSRVQMQTDLSLFPLIKLSPPRRCSRWSISGWTSQNYNLFPLMREFLLRCKINHCNLVFTGWYVAQSVKTLCISFRHKSSNIHKLGLLCWLISIFNTTILQHRHIDSVDSCVIRCILYMYIICILIPVLCCVASKVFLYGIKASSPASTKALA